MCFGFSTGKRVRSAFGFLASCAATLVVASTTARANVDLVLTAPVSVFPVEPGTDTIIEVELRAVWDGTIADPLCEVSDMGMPVGELFQSIDVNISRGPGVLECGG